MKKDNFLRLFVWCILSTLPIGCSALSIYHDVVHEFTIDRLNSLPLYASKAEVLKKLGAPSRKDAPPRESWSNWFYQNEGESRPRIILTVDEKKHVLLAKSINIWENEPESNIEYTISKFKPLRKRELPWTNPHIMPDEVYYQDPSRGISIEARKGRNEVVSISWFDPKNYNEDIFKAKPCKYYKQPSGLVSCLSEQP